MDDRSTLHVNMPEPWNHADSAELDSSRTVDTLPPCSPPAPDQVLAPRRTTRNRWEEALMSMPGAPAHHFVTDEQLDEMFINLGYRPSELAARRADYDKRMDAMLDLTGGKIPVIGVC